VVRFASTTSVNMIRVDLVRRLGLMHDSEVVEHEALVEYVCLFSRPLSQGHVVAFAALFGWSVPDEGDAADT
jgi:hypothetical protein